jgi:Xaa-Pro dipeptidase
VEAVEKEQAEAVEGIDRVQVYFDYPGDSHPLERVHRALLEINASPARTAADHDGSVPLWGYRGPLLSSLTGHPLADGEPLVEALRRVKSAAEVECISVACSWAVRGHRRMQAAIRTGQTEMESYAPAELETLREMIAEMPGWQPRGLGGSGITAMFVGGTSTAMPHGFVRGHGVRAGDLLVSGAAADVDGYLSELERTMVVAVAEVELAVVTLARELGRESNLRHHVGHSIGLEPHEAPFLDRGDDAVLEPGMVFTVEPGLYLPALGGFRHSDTVLITPTGNRVLTPYPTDLESLTIPL